MEMILNNLQLSNGKRVNYDFQSGSVTAICGSCRREVMNAIIHESDGVLFGANASLCPISYVPLKKKIDTNTLAKEELLLTFHRNNVEFDEEAVAKIFKILKVELNILNKAICDLTAREQKALLIANALIADSEVIVLDSIENGMHYKTKENLKKYLKTLANDFDKTIVIITNNLTFMFDLADNYLLVDEKKHFAVGTKKDFYSPTLYCCLDVPKIVEFTNYINNAKNRNIKEYIELKELLKAIYRDIENK